MYSKGFRTAVESDASMNEYPSGLDRETWSAAIMPFPPVLFSTTTVESSSRAMRSPMAREIRSVVAPGS
ncbi:hypothetical protein D9M68_848160 [compost metagenome]